MPHSSSRLSEGFAALIAPFDISTLDAMSATAVGLWPDGRIAYLNPAWLRFGATNGAPSSAGTGGLGIDLRLAAPPVLQPFYAQLFAKAIATGEVQGHDYECSSPDVHRTFRMAVYPCATGALVIVHSLLREAPHADQAMPPLERLYRNEHGLIVQCSNCRRIRRPGADEEGRTTWDWVPAYVAQMPPKTSHGICPLCAQFYYSGLG